MLKSKKRYSRQDLLDLIPLYNPCLSVYQRHALAFTLSWEQEESFEGTTRVAIWGVDYRHWPSQYNDMIPLDHSERLHFAIKFYLHHFWRPVCTICDNDQCHQVMFDTSVNQGFGPAQEIHNQFHDIPTMIIRRLQRYKKLAANSVYKPYYAGWTNRCLDLFDSLV